MVLRVIGLKIAIVSLAEAIERPETIVKGELFGLTGFIIDYGRGTTLRKIREKKKEYHLYTELGVESYFIVFERTHSNCYLNTSGTHFYIY